jgi:hypothetical protein
VKSQARPPELCPTERFLLAQAGTGPRQLRNLRRVSLPILATSRTERAIAAVAIVLASLAGTDSHTTRDRETWFVAAGFVGHSNGSIDRPFRTIREAVAAARSGDTIEIAGGTYEEGTIDLRSKALTLRGGFAVEAQNRERFEARDRSASPTVVVGRRDVGTDTGQHGAVFLLGQSDGARIDGFTITGGRHGIFAEYSTSREPLVIVNNIIEDNGVETPAYYEYGGGIHSEYPSLVIANNVIRGNRSGRGGGIAALGRGYARIEMNHIERNTALGDHGGGVYVQQPLLLRGNIVRSNAVTARIVNWMGGVGGGITIVAAAASLSDNLVTDNYAKKCGGGVFVDEGATATLSHEKVIGNQPVDPKGWGGSGIYVDGGANAVTDVHIVDSVILENAPGGPGIGNGIFAASRARVTVDGSAIQTRGARADVAIVDDTGTSSVMVSGRGSVGREIAPAGR